jgi:hypothetical protein
MDRDDRVVSVCKWGFVLILLFVAFAMVKGVTDRPAYWQASIMLRGKSVGLGLYKTAKQAAQAYDASARKHFGKFAKTNAMLGAL